MWLFWLYESLGFVGVILLIFAYCHFSKKGVWLLRARLCRVDLYNAARCYFRGESMHANTKYSIFWSECQIETTNGSYLPIDRTRALPGSKDHDSNDNGIPADNLIN